MTRYGWAAAIAAILGGAVCGCAGGTETGNPSFVAKLSYTAYSSNPESFGVRKPATVASVTAAWLVLGDVGFVKAGSCASTKPESVDAPGLGVGNHASEKPVSEEFELEDGAYCSVTLPVIRASLGSLPAAAPQDLVGSSVLIEGTLTSGATFTIRSATTPVVRLAPATGASFAMSPEMRDALIGFDVATWLGDLDWSLATVVAGRVEVSSDQNPAFLAAFESALSKGVTLYRDANGDGILDPSPDAIARGQ